MWRIIHLCIEWKNSMMLGGRFLSNNIVMLSDFEKIMNNLYYIMMVGLLGFCPLQALAEEGVRTKSDVKRLVSKKKGKLFFEYNKALKVSPNLSGSVVAVIEINPLGKVISCETSESTIASEALRIAVCSTLGDIDFGIVKNKNHFIYKHISNFAALK